MRLQTQAVRDIAAWPLETAAAQGRVAGFVMPRVTAAVPLSRVSIPQSRKAEFPRASWAWLAHVARNLALAVDAVHRAGVVIGDVNESNFLIRADTSVRLIDVDSFQVPDRGRILTCNVGVPMFTPPELQGRSFEGLVRTPEHDRFGLAVSIFTLLFMGRHPWAGMYAGPELSFDDGESIRRLPFAWSAEGRRLGFLPPPGSVRMDWLTADVGALFERALAGGLSGAARPSGEEWAATLDAFERELRTCDIVPLHRYLPERGDCPWCYLEQGDPPLRFFIGLGEPRRAALVDVAALERDVRAIAIPDFEPQPFDVKFVPRPRGYELPADLRAQRRLWWATCAGPLLVAALTYAGFGSGFAALTLLVALAALVATRPKIAAVRAYRSEARRAAQTRYDALATEWRRLNDPREIAGRKRALLTALEEYRSLPARYASELRSLERRKRELQLRAHLDRFSLEDATIPGLGKKKKTALLRYGMRSAADLSEGVTSIPGLGAASRYALGTWHGHLKSRFRYDPSAPLDERVLADLHAREQADRARLEATLRAGPRQLASALERRARERDDLRLPLEAAALALAKANADVRRVTLRPFA